MEYALLLLLSQKDVYLFYTLRNSKTFQLLMQASFPVAKGMPAPVLNYFVLLSSLFLLPAKSVPLSPIPTPPGSKTLIEFLVETTV